MAPERPRSLVILDLSEPGAQDGGTVYHWDPVDSDRELVVLWEAARCPGDFVDTVANVACVAVPPGFTEYRYTLERPPEPLIESWRGQPRGSILMVIAILPPGYVLDEPQGGDWPIKAKIVGERLAIYWIFAGNETVEPACRIVPIDDVAALVECAARINQRPSPLELPEPPVPAPAELHEWAKRRSDPVEGRP
jgi:hypothetical protein